MSRTDDDVEDLPFDSSDYPTETESTSEFETEGTEAQGEDEEPEFYDTNDFISKPFLTEDSKVPEDILVFEYVSFSGLKLLKMQYFVMF